MSAVSIASHIASVANFGVSSLSLYASAQSKVLGLMDKIAYIKSLKLESIMTKGRSFTLDDVINIPRLLENNGEKALAGIRNFENKVTHIISKTEAHKQEEEIAMKSAGLIPVSRSELEEF